MLLMRVMRMDISDVRMKRYELCKVSGPTMDKVHTHIRLDSALLQETKEIRVRTGRWNHGSYESFGSSWQRHIERVNEALVITT